MRCFQKHDNYFPMKNVALVLIGMIVLCGLSLTKQEANESNIIDPDPYPWPESPSEAQGLDSSILKHAFDQAEKLEFVNSVLVVKDGYLIGERYFFDQDRYISNDIASCTKSIMSALIGIALKEGYLENLDQKMMDFFPEFAFIEMDQRKFNITIRHLLQMRSGYPFDEGRDDFNSRWWASLDKMRFSIEYPLTADPGTVFAYSSPSTHILSGIITKVTGMNTLEFAQQYLFTPMDISIGNWMKDQQGYYIGGGGINMSSMDMARFGYLYLNKGSIGDRQFLQESFVRDSCQSYSDEVTWFQRHFTDFGYGYLWWTAKAAGYEVYFALGHGGQTIVLVPELNMIIVTAANSGVTPNESGFQINAVFDLVVHYVLEPIRCLNGHPPYFPSAVSAKKARNNGLAYREYLNVLRWEPNPRNAAVNITKYRIYEVIGESLRLLDEVSASTFEFWDRNVDKYKHYTYAISAVTNSGLESIPAYVSAIYPTN